MQHSGYELSASLREPFCRGYSFTPTKHFLGRGGKKIRYVTEINPSLWNAAGGLHSTLGDLIKFATALGRGSLVSPPSYAAQTDWSETPWEDHQYGLLLAKIHELIGHVANL
jgi:hypothetical protein